MDIYKSYLSIVEDELQNKTTTTDYELNKYCKKVFGKKFRGVYPIDQIPKIKNNESIIFNLDRSDQNGSHWMALYCFDNKNYVYDSFGRTSKQLNVPIHAIDTEYDSEQKIKESNCGQRCISFLACCYTLPLNICLTI